ncbi:TRAPP complex core subunit BET3 NDAI_0H00710 [Naumovozyma dairenensis CBS 421]|uniref:Trafficking protein particle complex subunit BET3 n=1 Tax=Naumovozyma dairenensis (strain ATCC 10597 / BCRC 20456 / CBS 421 / NBRC 0211 / NRRL Y-12639) TaxID=1071378 RepID=G0WEN4_NAUDC|nr:hypothetical protein NDAI_0H00710 [Naumovozyma dairenensis CBS 421]CCD26245.1 hypothetical protein NDAI_0H00710 [Naumovozyma dairenensis CBS 421]
MSKPQPSGTTSATSSSSSQIKSLKLTGEDIWKNKTEKINTELFTLTYGSIVSQLCNDFQRDFEKVNENLFSMGYNIGVRLIEDFLARTALPRCENLVNTSEVISLCAFKIFLNITPQITNWDRKKEAFSLILIDNPLSEFVELPMDAMKELWYSNILCGVLKGALEMVQLDCDVWFVSDILRGDPQTELRIKLNRILKDEIPIGRRLSYFQHKQFKTKFRIRVLVSRVHIYIYIMHGRAARKLPDARNMYLNVHGRIFFIVFFFLLYFFVSINV